MKDLNFKNIEIGDEVTFIDSDSMLNIGIVDYITNTTFRVRSISSYKKDEKTTIVYDSHYSFHLKSGKKGSHRNTYGNAISFTKMKKLHFNN